MDADGRADALEPVPCDVCRSGRVAGYSDRCPSCGRPITPVRPSFADVLTPCAQWTPDCQGKWDYDGRLIDISTRYWPRGGGFSEYNPATGRWIENQDRPDLRPAATASILLRHGEPGERGYGDYITLAEQEFSGETEAEVKAEVERWVATQFRAIAALVATHYGAPLEP